MLKHATTLTFVGFLLLIFGFFTLFLNLVGVDFFLTAWLYEFNVGLSYAVRLLMVLAGFILIYV
ncbi:MAG: hypothetical protein AAFN92_16625, partial [Bacteroidota bacterium]